MKGMMCLARLRNVLGIGMLEYWNVVLFQRAWGSHT